MDSLCFCVSDGSCFLCFRPHDLTTRLSCLLCSPGLHWINAQVGVNCAVFTGRGVYPTADAIDEAREMAKRIGAASVVGIGGGGAIDTAKATARLHTSR